MLWRWSPSTTPINHHFPTRTAPQHHHQPVWDALTINKPVATMAATTKSSSLLLLLLLLILTAATLLTTAAVLEVTTTSAATTTTTSAPSSTYDAVDAAAAADDDDAEILASYHGRRRRRNRHGSRTPTVPSSPTRPSPSPPSTPAVPSSPSTQQLPYCDRPDVPPMFIWRNPNGTSSAIWQNGTTTSSQSQARTDCVPRPPPSSSPPQPPPSSSPSLPPRQPPRFRRPALCTCPIIPKPGGAGGSPGAPGAGGASSGGGGGMECVGPITSLMSCSAFITGSAEETPTPGSDCCVALGAFVNRSSAATAAGTGDGGLRCLCPFIVGGVNKLMPRPVDPVRLMYLPIACGVVLPPQVLFMCFTGHSSPYVVTNFSQLWEEDTEKGVHGG